MAVNAPFAYIYVDVDVIIEITHYYAVSLDT